MKLKPPITIFLVFVILIIVSIVVRQKKPTADIIYTTNYIDFTTPSLKLDKLYYSMEGPIYEEFIPLSNDTLNKRIWATNFETSLLDSEGKKLNSNRFLCHSSVYNDSSDYLFSFIQGQKEIELPKGFAIPVHPQKLYNFSVQLLNVNEPSINKDIRVNVKLTYLPEDRIQSEVKPLMVHHALGFLNLNKKDLKKGSHSHLIDEHNSKVCVFEKAKEKKIDNLYFGPIMNDESLPDQNQFLSGHWQVPPGKQVVRNDTTDILNIPYDTTIHYAVVHVHPFGESIELWDKTQNISVCKINIKNVSEGVGIEEVEFYSDEVGIPIYKDHEYELITVYNNTSKEVHSAMSVMFLYLHDKDYKIQKGENINKLSNKNGLNNEYI